MKRTNVACLVVAICLIGLLAGCGGQVQSAGKADIAKNSVGMTKETCRRLMVAKLDQELAKE